MGHDDFPEPDPALPNVLREYLAAEAAFLRCARWVMTDDLWADHLTGAVFPQRRAAMIERDRILKATSLARALAAPWPTP